MISDKIRLLTIYFLKGLQDKELLELHSQAFKCGYDVNEDSYDLTEDMLETLQIPQNLLVSSSKKKITSITSLKKTTQLISILGLISELLAQNKNISLRDIFYRFKGLFQRQDECNLNILQAGQILHLKRADMHIFPKAKSRIVGPILINLLPKTSLSLTASEIHINCELSDQNINGIQIEPLWFYKEYLISYSFTGLEQITHLVIVEKEAIFYRLIEDKFLSKFPCILLTSSGYPDIAIRRLVKGISDQYPTIEIVGLCDYNPHGLALLLCFRYATKNSLFESQDLQIPLQWIGLRNHHICNLLQLNPLFHTLLQKYSDSDNIKIRALKQLPILQNSPLIQKELLLMEQYKMKFELESLYLQGFEFISDFLITTLLNKDYLF